MRFQGALKSLSIFLTIIIATAININAEQNYAIPDFAYPKTASSNAIAKLDASLKSGDDILAIRQLMDYGLAQSVIGNDNIHGEPPGYSNDCFYYSRNVPCLQENICTFH